MTIEVIDDGENIIYPTDYEGKYKEIRERLQNDLFDGITEQNTKIVNRMTGTYYKERVGRNEILPKLTTVQVTATVNKCLRKYLPLSLGDARSLDPQHDILKALNYFLELMEFINKYIVYVPDKILLCGFFGFTTDVFDELVKETAFHDVLKSAEESIMSMNTTASISSLTDQKTSQFIMGARGVGHSVTRADEPTQIGTINFVDKESVHKLLAGFQGMQKQIGNKK